MWTIIFLGGLAVVLLLGLRNPAWWTCGAAYLYFAIPGIEFNAPGAPYQAGLWGLAVLGSFTIYARRHKWSRMELHTRATEAVRLTVESVREQIKASFADKVSAGSPPGAAAPQAFATIEDDLVQASIKNSPAALQGTVEMVSRSILQEALQKASTTATRVLERASRSTKGNLRASMATQTGTDIDDTLSTRPEIATPKAVDDIIESSEETNETASPLDMPTFAAPIEGVLTNTGLYFHFAWMMLTFMGLKTAVYSQTRGAHLPFVCILLLIPLFSIIASIRTPLQFKMFAYAWVFGTWHICMNGVNYFLRYGGRADNAGGQGGESNFLAAIIVLVAPIAFGLALMATTKLERVLFFFASGCFALGVLASGSRAGLLALIGGAAYWLMHTNKKGVAIALSLIGCACFMVVAPESFWERMGTILGPQDSNPWIRNAVEPSKGERLELWHLAIREFGKYPISGIGPANFTAVSAMELPNATDPYLGLSGLQAHNAWLQIAAEYGIFGILVWGGGFFYSFFCHRRSRQLVQNRPELRWFAAINLGFEAGALSSAVMLCFMSFHWYDYNYWHLITGPLALHIARRAVARDEWLKPKTIEGDLAPARYGKRRTGDLEDIDLSEAAPLN